MNRASPSIQSRQRGAADLTRSAVPRYLQLASVFVRRIESGAWKPGRQIPTVENLSDEWGVASATIRQALGKLEADGLIERTRGRGTFVRQRPPEPLWCDIQTDWSGLLQERAGATIEVLASHGKAVLPPEPPDLGTPAASYRHLRRRHWRDGNAFLLADVYVDERLWRKIRARDLVTRTAFNLVASLPGVEVADARQTVTVGSADLETAEHLGVSLNAPVAHVKRLLLDEQGTLILVAYGIYRGDRVRFDLKLAIKRPGG
jgi:GntR family transcriptional regulator